MQNQILNAPMKAKPNAPKLSDSIYRTIPLSRLYQLFSTHQNVLVRPKMWDDPFENLALNSTADLYGEKASFGFANDIYAQCWTSHKASDAIWRIYSNGTDGIRIKSTVGKVLSSLYDSTSKFAELSCFMGKVGYYSDKSLVNFSKNHFASGLDHDGKNIAQTMLVKRYAFVHEREIRLVYFDQQNPHSTKDLLPYSIDPHEMIDQIMLHPQLGKSDADNLKSEIIKKTGYKGKIKRSLLYKPPEGFIFKVSAH